MKLFRRRKAQPVFQLTSNADREKCGICGLVRKLELMVHAMAYPEEHEATLLTPIVCEDCLKSDKRMFHSLLATYRGPGKIEYSTALRSIREAGYFKVKRSGFKSSWRCKAIFEKDWAEIVTMIMMLRDRDETFKPQRPS